MAGPPVCVLMGIVLGYLMLAHVSFVGSSRIDLDDQTGVETRLEFGVIFRRVGGIAFRRGHALHTFRMAELTEPVFPNYLRRCRRYIHPINDRTNVDWDYVCSRVEGAVRDLMVRYRELTSERQEFLQSLRLLVPPRRRVGRRSILAALGTISTIGFGLVDMFRQRGMDQNLQRIQGYVGDLGRKHNRLAHLVTMNIQETGTELRWLRAQIDRESHALDVLYNDTMNMNIMMRNLTRRVNAIAMYTKVQWNIVAYYSIYLQRYRDQIQRYQAGLQTALKGFLPMDFVSGLALSRVLANVTDNVKSRWPNLKPEYDDYSYYYRARLVQVDVVRHHILIHLSIPLTSEGGLHRLYQVERIKMPITPGSNDVTKLNWLPAYMAINEQNTDYVPIEHADLASCESDDNLWICPKMFPERTLTSQTCMAGLIVNDLEIIRERCDYEVHLDQYQDTVMVHVDGSRYLVTSIGNRSEGGDWVQECVNHTTSVHPCELCIVEAECGCILKIDDNVIPSSMGNCHVVSGESNVTLDRTMNMIFLAHLFEDATDLLTLNEYAAGIELRELGETLNSLQGDLDIGARHGIPISRVAKSLKENSPLFVTELQEQTHSKLHWMNAGIWVVGVGLVLVMIVSAGALIRGYIIFRRNKGLIAGATLLNMITTGEAYAIGNRQECPTHDMQWVILALSSLTAGVLLAHFVYFLYKRWNRYPFASKMVSQMTHLSGRVAKTLLNLELVAPDSYLLVNIMSLPISLPRIAVRYDPTKIKVAVIRNWPAHDLLIDWGTACVGIDGMIQKFAFPKRVPISWKQAQVARDICNQRGYATRIIISTGAYAADPRSFLIESGTDCPTDPHSEVSTNGEEGENLLLSGKL